MMGATATPIVSLLLQSPSFKDLFGGMVPLLAMLVIFWFLLILPAQRQRKKTNEMLAALKAGDKVITNSGIYGTIVGVEGDAVQVRIADQVKVKMTRASIAGMQPEPKEEK